MKRLFLAGLLLVATAAQASAQTVDLGALIPGGGASATARIVQLVAILTILSVAPGLLIMVTSFTRFVVALSFLRSGLGLQSAPPNLVLISLSLFMTFYVMAPTFSSVALILAASSLLTPSFTGLGAPSTKSLASLRPRPVIARTP